MKRLAFILPVLISLYGTAQVYHRDSTIKYVGAEDPELILCDLDNDGYLDRIHNGIWDQTGQPEFSLCINQRNSTFICYVNSIQPSIKNLSVADFDNDNDIDLLVGGEILYKNVGGTLFDEAGTIPKSDESSAWGDFDRDGDLDILNVGWLNTGSYLMRNDRDSFANTNLELAPGFSADWADYDRDGDLDFVIGGYLASTDYYGAIIYEQDADTFKVLQGTAVSSFRQMSEAEVKWVNIDFDKELELVVAGKLLNNEYAVDIYDRVLINFKRLANAFPETVDRKPYGIATADYDNDGDMDIAIGNHGLFQNNYEVFTMVDSIFIGEPAFGDLNNDGNVDLFSQGFHETWDSWSANTGLIYRNLLEEKNKAPQAPVNLTTQYGAPNQIIFSWDDAIDDHTPAANMTYNTYLLDFEENIISSGQHEGDDFLLAKHGAYTNNGNFIIQGLDSGIYKWSVQAIDGAFLESKFAEEHIFTVGRYVYIPDTNLLHSLIDKGYDLNMDSLISYSEADYINDLDVSNLNIEDATGVECFVNLMHLNISNNPISVLHVNTLNNLETLDARNCDLNLITFPRNNTLFELYLDNNEFTSWDFTRLDEINILSIGNNWVPNVLVPCPTLKKLWIDGGQFIDAINISACTQLAELNISGADALVNLDLKSNNLLTALTLVDNAVLQEVCVWQLPFPTNGMTSTIQNCPLIQFSPCLNEVYIPDQNFRDGLIVNGADANNDNFITYEEALNLTAIHVSYLGINDLTGLQAFKNVQTFIAKGNNITSFAVDSIPLLAELNISNNQVSNMDLSLYPALQILDAANNQLSSLDLSTSPELISAKAGNNNISSLTTTGVKKLEELSIVGNQLLDVDLSDNPALITLMAGKNPFTTIGTGALKQLEHLWLDSCLQLSSLNLKSNLNLNTLSVSHTGLSRLDVKNNQALQLLNIKKNKNLTSLCVWQLPFPPSYLNYTHNHSNVTDISTCTMEPDTWVQLENVPSEGIRYVSGFVANDSAYIGTGFTNQYVDNFWAFDPITEYWETKAVFPGRLENFGKGFGSINKGYVMTHDDASGSFWKYDNTNNTWSTINAPAGGGTSFPAGFVAQENIYVHGGEQNGIETDALWRFNPNTQTWSQMATGPTARSKAFAFGTDTAGYIGGGFDVSDNVLQDFWKYNVNTNTWSQLPDLSKPRAEAVSVNHQGRLFFGGGLDQNYTTSKDWYEFFPNLDTIVIRKDLPGDARTGAIALSVGNIILFGTGYNNTQSFNDWWKYQSADISGVSEINQQIFAVQLYPNPVNDKLYIQGIKGESTITLLDLSGRMVFEKKIQGQQVNIPASLRNGSYLLKVANQGKQAYGKVVVQH